MKTIEQKIVIDLTEHDEFYLASIELPREVAEELSNIDKYIPGFDGERLEATAEKSEDAVKQVLVKLQEQGYTGRAKLNRVEKQKTFRIHVKQWMLKPATEDFDFHAKWNNNIPMPMAIMEGVILQETKGMYRMKLRGSAEPSSYCRVCGAKLTNKLSLLYGIGPECSGKIGLPRVASEDELEAHYEHMKEIAENVIWEGWVIKKGIKTMDEVIEVEADKTDEC